MHMQPFTQVLNIEKTALWKHMLLYFTMTVLHLWAKIPILNSHTGGGDGGLLTRVAKWILWPVHFPIRFNFHIYEPLIPFQWTVMELATSTQVIIKSQPLVTSVIHLCSGSLILQPIIGAFNKAYWKKTLAAANSGWNKMATVQGVRLPRRNI